MTKVAGSVVTIGLSALAFPAVAQEYYAGGAFSLGSVKTVSTYPTRMNDIRAVDLFGGARFNVSTNLYVGVEAQGSLADGYVININNNGKSTQSIQGELHLGVNTGWGRVYGFAGLGRTDFSGLGNTDITKASKMKLGGVGAEISVTDNLAVRVEAELADISVTDNCCGAFKVSTKEVSLGIVYDF